MNSNLSPFANFGAYIHDLLSMYLLPVGLPVAVIVVLLLLLIGRGKAVEVAAPVQEQQAIPDSVQKDKRPAILVVDDSAVARAKLSKLFESGGYRVELAKDGLEAMEKLLSDFFAVLVTDLEMPNMNGLELIAAVQGGMETEDLPIIAITGHDELQARVHDYQGLFGIFKKPWNDRELLKRVETLAVLRKRKV
ncbi:MAG: response regulator [Pseudomonadota bacterium]